MLLAVVTMAQADKALIRGAAYAILAATAAFASFQVFFHSLHDGTGACQCRQSLHLALACACIVEPNPENLVPM